MNDFGALSASVATSVARESSEAKLDPVSQAIYDNMMGKLPKKRKLEIPCTACDMIFNSEVRGVEGGGIREVGGRGGKRDREGERGIGGKTRNTLYSV